jgi:hypothetical protein
MPDPVCGGAAVTKEGSTMVAKIGAAVVMAWLAACSLAVQAQQPPAGDGP